MPIYMDKENSNYTIEKERVDVFLKIYKGELQFIKNISALLGGYFVDFSCALYDKYIANYDKNLSENDKKYLSKLKHGLGQISNTYVAMGLDSPMSRLFNELRNNMERKK